MVDAIEWHRMMLFHLLKYEFFGMLNWKHALVNNGNGIAVKWLQLRKHAYARKSYLRSKVHLLMYQHRYINIIIAVYFSFNEEKSIITHDKKEGLTGVLANGLI